MKWISDTVEPQQLKQICNSSLEDIRANGWDWFWKNEIYSETDTKLIFYALLNWFESNEQYEVCAFLQKGLEKCPY